jgi:ABC-type cobalamin/Fe3+-siderophores transport system ATPase subunit
VIVRTIRLEAWRCFVAPITVGPFSEGLNVVHAPNGTGKSTLFEALRRALLDNHGVRAREAQNLRPWGRALPPSVTVEFAHGGQEYRLSKRFLDDAMSLLERREVGRWVALAQRDKADEYVQAMLTRHPPERGLAEPRHWGLAQILWAPQGDLRLGRPSDDLVADIRACLGAHVHAEAASALEARIEERYLQHYAPRSGELRTGRHAPPRVQLEQRLAQAREQVRAARALCEEFDAVARRVEQHRAVRAAARRESERLARELASARARAAEYAALAGERAARRARLEGAEARSRALRQAIDAIASARRELASAREGAARLREEAARQEREVEALEGAAQVAKAAFEEVRRARDEVEALDARAEDARRIAQAWAEVKALDARCARLAAAREELARCRQARDAVTAPDERALKAIRKALAEREAAEARLSAALITLEVLPLRDGVLEVQVAERAGSQLLSEGQTTTVRGAPEVVVELPGVARVIARGPAGSVDALRSARDAAAQRVAELTASFGTDDLEALEACCDRASALAQRVRDAETLLRALQGGEGEEAILARRSRALAEAEALLARHPDWRDEPPDAEALRAQAEAARRAFAAREGAAQARWEDAAQALLRARALLAGLQSRQEETEKQTRVLEARLADLTRDGRSDEARAEALDRVALDWREAEVGLREVETRLSAVGEDPAREVARLERALREAEEAAEAALAREKTEEGRLAQLAAAAPHSALARAEEEEERVGAELSREVLRTEAIRLLRNLVHTCRAEAVSAVSAPVEQEATRILHRVAGARLGRVTVGDGFEPVAVVPEEVRSEVELGSVSGGEREQVYLATRLALAEVLARDERQMVVLDDVLTATDAGRMSRVLEVLEEKARALQIVVITCHPERYRALTGATFFDLESLARASVDT